MRISWPRAPSPCDPRLTSIPPKRPGPWPHLRNAQVHHDRPEPLPPPRPPGPPEAGSSIRPPILQRGRASRTGATTEPGHRPDRVVRRRALEVLADSFQAIEEPSVRTPSLPTPIVRHRPFRVGSISARSCEGAPCHRLPVSSPRPAGRVPAWPGLSRPESAPPAQIPPQAHLKIEAGDHSRFRSDPWPAPPSIPPARLAVPASGSTIGSAALAPPPCEGCPGGPSYRNYARSGPSTERVRRSGCGCGCAAPGPGSWRGRRPEKVSSLRHRSSAACPAAHLG